MIIKTKKEMTNHERVPRQSWKELSEQLGSTQLVNDPVIAVAVKNGLVKVENNYHAGATINHSHCLRTYVTKKN